MLIAAGVPNLEGCFVDTGSKSSSDDPIYSASGALEGGQHMCMAVSIDDGVSFLRFISYQAWTLWVEKANVSYSCANKQIG